MRGPHRPIEKVHCTEMYFVCFLSGGFTTKSELLQLKPHPFICMRNFINKKVGNQKTMPTFIISIFKVEY